MRVDVCLCQSAHSVFSDHHMVLYRRFFPRQMDDQVRPPPLTPMTINYDGVGW